VPIVRWLVREPLNPLGQRPNGSLPPHNRFFHAALWDSNPGLGLSAPRFARYTTGAVCKQVDDAFSSYELAAKCRHVFLTYLHFSL
jgi:hypothetical protein